MIIRMMMAAMLLLTGCGVTKTRVALEPEPNSCQSIEVRRVLSTIAFPVCWDTEGRAFTPGVIHGISVAEIVRDATGLAVLGAVGVYIGTQLPKSGSGASTVSVTGVGP